MSFTKITSTDLQNKGVIGLADTPGLDTSHMQQKFDEIALDVIVPKFNNLIDELEDAGYDPSTGDVMHKATYDSDNDGKVDSAEDSDTVNGHTVESDVPDDAVFTDTTYTAGTNVSISDENVISATVPTKTSDLTNDSGFITASDIPAIPSKTSDLTNDSGFITSSALPTKVSDLTNDAGYSSTLSGLTDTSISNPSNNQILKYNSTSGKWENGTGGGGGSSTLADLDDVSLSSQTDGQVLEYDSATSKWKNASLPDITGKADKVTNATNGNFAGLDSNGNLTDSGSKASDFLTQHQDISGKLNTDGSNAASVVKLSGSFTVGNRAAGSPVGTNSVANGYQTNATGNYSHAEGYNTTSYQECSHAEGQSTYASGVASHAEGAGTVAAYDFQHVSGIFNDNKSTTLFEIGNGTYNDPSNAFEVYSDGTLSTDNGTTKVKLENLMLASVYDSTSAVANAGGIVNYIDAVITSALTASY